MVISHYIRLLVSSVFVEWDGQTASAIIDVLDAVSGMIFT